MSGEVVGTVFVCAVDGRIRICLEGTPKRRGIYIALLPKDAREIAAAIVDASDFLEAVLQ